MQMKNEKKIYKCVGGAAAAAAVRTSAGGFTGTIPITARSKPPCEQAIRTNSLCICRDLIPWKKDLTNVHKPTSKVNIIPRYLHSLSPLCRGLPLGKGPPALGPPPSGRGTLQAEVPHKGDFTLHGIDQSSAMKCTIVSPPLVTPHIIAGGELDNVAAMQQIRIPGRSQSNTNESTGGEYREITQYVMPVQSN